MRIVIQNAQDSTFLTAAMQWTPHLREARVFDNFRIAVELCSEKHLRHVQVVLMGGDEHADIAIPIEDRPSQPAAPPPEPPPAQPGNTIPLSGSAP